MPSGFMAFLPSSSCRGPSVRGRLGLQFAPTLLSPLQVPSASVGPCGQRQTDLSSGRAAVGGNRVPVRCGYSCAGSPVLCRTVPPCFQLCPSVPRLVGPSSERGPGPRPLVSLGPLGGVPAALLALTQQGCLCLQGRLGFARASACHLAIPVQTYWSLPGRLPPGKAE